MKSKALRLYGKNDLRLEEFELPAIKEDEILADVVTNSICMSDHKATIQGADHKRVPDDVADDPIIIGHEFCGSILEVGAKYKDKYKVGSKYSIQPALSYPGRELEAPGYSFRTCGGQAQKIIIPREVLEMDCLLPYDGPGFYPASLSEPVSCNIGAFYTNYHFKQGEYKHSMGIKKGGAMAILAGAGPMGLSAIDYALHGDNRPGLLVITDIDQVRLDRAASLYSPEHASTMGVKLVYANTGGDNPLQLLSDLTGGKGFDDVFVYAPVPFLIDQASSILAFNGCLNFFAGPGKSDFKASINFYDVHYSGHHVVGSSGGNTDDMREALKLMAESKINPAVMVTHVGGLDHAAETTLNLPKIPGGKKLIYTTVSMPLVALDDIEQRASESKLYAGLAGIVKEHNGLWSLDAENFLLTHAAKI